MEPEPGDELVIDGDEKGRGARVGTILALRGGNGHPVYLVHWVTGDYDALVSPWPGVYVRHREHQCEPASRLDRDRGSGLAAS